MVTPPGLTSVQWTAALAKLAAIVGGEGLFSSSEDMALYRDAYSPAWGEAEETLVAAAVAPVTVEQVQAVVRLANEFGIPLFPISTGKNLGYGGSAPNLSGSVVVDLKRMNKIIEVDDKRHFAIVEPGVSYFDLYRHIRDRGLNVWIDCPEPGWGSVVGNSLDHGIGHSWWIYRDHFLSHAGMEVVLPNGDLMRTGMGAMPGAKTFGEFRYGFGPYVDGLFSQAGFGIVTKMGFHLMPVPEAVIRKRITAWRTQDIIPMVELTNELEHLGLIGMPIYDSPMFAHQFRDPALMQLGQAPDAFESQAIDAYAVANNVGRWSLTMALYGPAVGIEANWRWMRERFARVVPDAHFEDLESLRFPLDPEQVEAVQHKVTVGIPNMNIFSITARSPANPAPFDGHLFYTPVIPRSGESVLEAQRLLGVGTRELGLATPLSHGPFTAPVTWIPHAFLLPTGLPVSRSDPAVNRRSREALRKLIDLGARHGFGEHRAHVLFQDQVMNTYSFNDNALRTFCETLKDAVDPNGVIAPGRGGFWPARFRKGRTNKTAASTRPQ